MLAISSNHNSVDGQACDAMAHLRDRHSVTYRKVIKDFPEYDTAVMTQPSGAWFNTDAMGVDVEWGSWLINAIEQHSHITWDDGEPYCNARGCR